MLPVHTKGEMAEDGENNKKTVWKSRLAEQIMIATTREGGVTLA